MKGHRHTHDVKAADTEAIARAIVALTQAGHMRWSKSLTSYLCVHEGIQVFAERDVFLTPVVQLFSVAAGVHMSMAFTRAERRSIVEAAAAQVKAGQRMSTAEVYGAKSAAERERRRQEDERTERTVAAQVMALMAAGAEADGAGDGVDGGAGRMAG